MHESTSLLRAVPRRTRASRMVALAAIMMMACITLAHAQLNGTYTIGGASPNYATIDAAIAALAGTGVSGPVQFRIRTGTYVPPAAGYVLATYTGMNATNTVTFKPDAGATVTIAGTTNTGTAIFYLNAGKYYIFDGSNTVGGTTKDMTIRQTETTYDPAFWLLNDADLNVIKNCIVQGNAASATKTSSANGIGIIFIGVTTAATGNDSNLVQNCTIGDPSGVYRSNVAVGCYGTSSKPNTGNKITRCDIVNFGNAGTYGYGVVAYGEQNGTVVDGCDIHMTVPAGSGISTMYGLYTDYAPGYPINSVFTNNKIYNMTSAAANWTIYGIYHWVSTSTANTLISNNMFSFTQSGDHTVYGIYFQSNSGNTNLYNNSFYIGGASTGTRSVYSLYKGSSNTFDSRNNIFYTSRTGGTASNYGMYISTTGGISASYNLINTNSAANFYTGYYSANKVTLADYKTASAQENNSIGTVPPFIDPASGNLHISTTVRTAVESRGTPVALVPTDIDGDVRNGTTPDLGADEGPFLAPLTNDLSAERLITPAPGAVGSANILFTPVVSVGNPGIATQNNVNVRYRILNASNTVVYSDIQTVASIPLLSSVQVSFNQNGNQAGNTNLGAGTYTIELTTQLAGDQDATNDVITGTITLKAPLNGIYTIDKLGAGARNFTSFTSAVADLNQLGVTGPVTFQIANGTYDATTETFPLTLTAAPGVNATNTVTFRPAVGASPTITASSPVGSAIFVIEGGKYYTFDGSNVVGGTSRNLTIRQTEATYNPTFWLRNDADFNAIKNCIVQGNAASATKSSSANGIGIIFIGVTTAATGNDSNLVQNCTIGDPSGVYRNNIGIGCYGTSAKPNSGNKIMRCDIVNFGNANTYAYGVVAYGEQAGTVVDGCDIHMTVQAPSGINTIYGLYTDYAPGYPINSVFNGNRIYKLTSAAANWTIYGIFHWVSTSTSNTLISNNMFSFAETGDHTIYGIYYSSSLGNTNLYNNSFYFGGSSTGSRAMYAIYKNSANTIVSRNNIFYSSRTGGTASNYGMYLSSTSGWTASNNLINMNSGTNFYTGYYSGARATLADYVASSGQDANSITGTVPYIDPVNGDLHLNTVPVFAGESRGTPVGVTLDFDNQSRDASYPDMGADEGDFNGGGIHVVSPNGGEKYSVDYSLDVNYTLTRPLSVRIDFSTDGGSSWTTKGTFNGVAGANISTITTPSNITSTARVRIVSTKNTYEADTSDANFELVLPVFTIVAPNGGEKLVPTDTTKLVFNAQFTPPAMRLRLDYSINNGSTWIPIDTNVYAANLPAVNNYNWIVPNAPTQQALVRVKVAGGTINDASDAVFTITPQPSVALVTPVGGVAQYVGDVTTIRWTSVTTQAVKLDYSIDGGASWLDVVPNGQTIPAYVESYPWKVPNTPTNNALVRITNVDRPRFRDTTRPAFAILRSGVQVILPNGGEKYELNQPVTVTWTAQNATTLRVEFSSDNGGTWTKVANVPGASGTYTFTPPALPTKRALVRLVNVDRETVQDVSDNVFELMQEKSIVVYSPAAGDRYLKGSTATIMWDAPRINNVSISYSSNGGGTWQTVTSSVLASMGSFTWSVPTQLTSQAKIRIQEVGGSTIGESDLFSIVDEAQPVVRVLVPNGGESYFTGDSVHVRWSSTAVNAVNVSYSTDNANWTVIKSNVAATAGQITWATNAVAASTTYRIKVESTTGNVSDVSDGPFTIARKLNPGITVLSPNGGENLTIGSTADIRWTAQDLNGNVKIELSRDNGVTWDSVGSALSTAGTYSWAVTGDSTSQALVRVGKQNVANGLDTSDAVFSISRKVVEPIVVLAPNGGEQWYMQSKQDIKWTAPSSVTAVDIEYSTDGGGNWISVQTNVASAGATPQFTWTIPNLSSPSQSALIRISDHATSGLKDISNNTFSVLNPVAGVEAPVAGMSSLNLLGNFPNPFAASTELRWRQAGASDVEIRIYEQNGTMVGRYSAGHREGGEQHFTVGSADLASGAYIYEVRTGKDVARGVMLLVR